MKRVNISQGCVPKPFSAFTQNSTSHTPIHPISLRMQRQARLLAEDLRNLALIFFLFLSVSEFLCNSHFSLRAQKTLRCLSPSTLEEPIPENKTQSLIHKNGNGTALTALLQTYYRLTCLNAHSSGITQEHDKD